ncbi:MAG: regulatory iron-sulfur-containing complex subunit RicT [Verrucomicrobiota bacterium]|nr:regulatory iron-sulfur-containing complex subunit RicT [Verrucomicrobiota bacterium]
MNNIYEVEFDKGIRFFCSSTQSLEKNLKTNDMVIVKNDTVMDMGKIFQIKTVKDKGKGTGNMPIILRHANLRDKGKAHENEIRSKSMHRSCLKMIKDHGLPMKLIKTHCTFDKSLVIFLFSAEGRVDFRELVRDLAKQLNMKVELRQIGVRDETGITGGIGPCGRPLCCSLFLHNFQSIGVKVAKDQGLSLNPVNISGRCERLKCCLKYEHECYLELAKEMPRVHSSCNTPRGRGKVIESNYLKKTVRVKLNDDSAQIVEFSKDEITK